MNLTWIESQNVYIWGARQHGINVAAALMRRKMPPAGFIDSSPEVQGCTIQGIRVFAPKEILSKPLGTYYIIISTAAWDADISALAASAGLEPEKHFTSASSLQKIKRLDIDVSNKCNLRCSGCGHGNWPVPRSAGFMEPEFFDKVLDKALREDPFLGSVSMYEWGEPLLHPQLPELITIANTKGLAVSISSNLNYAQNLCEVVKAYPAYFRVSASGFGAGYERTHVGGRWELFHANLLRLASFWREYSPGMVVEMNYHIYRDREEEAGLMRQLCAQLGIIFRPGLGIVSPVDNVECLLQGKPLTEAAQKCAAMQAAPLEDGFAYIEKNKLAPCPREAALTVAWNGHVAQCSCWFDPKIPPLTTNFLETPLNEIFAARKKSAFCAACKKQGIHMWPTFFQSEQMTEKYTPNSGHP